MKLVMMKTQEKELLGNSTKAREQMGWTTEYTFDQLLQEMVENDCN